MNLSQAAPFGNEFRGARETELGRVDRVHGGEVAPVLEDVEGAALVVRRVGPDEGICIIDFGKRGCGCNCGGLVSGCTVQQRVSARVRTRREGVHVLGVGPANPTWEASG